jgi:hypothetical protein
MKDPQIKIKQTDLLSDNHYILNKVTFDYQKNDDSWITQKRSYDRGNGSAILLYNTKQNSHSNSSVSFTNVPQRKQNRDDD